MNDFSHRHAELQFKCGEDSLFPVQLSVYEELSRPFEARVTARSHKHDIRLEDIVGFSAGLRATGRLERVWTGVCRSIELSHAEPDKEGLSTYFLVIVPNLWLLTQRSGHRIFQHQSAVEIVGQLLDEWGVEHVFKVEEQHPKLEYRVQYGESDFAFVSRILEEAGIAYYFDTPSDHEQRTTKLVLQELPERVTLGPFPYHDSPPEAEAGHYVTRVRVGQRSATGQVTLGDFDLRRPEAALYGRHASALSSEPEKTWERYHFSPGGFLVETTGGGDTPVADDKSVARHDDARGAALAHKTLMAAQQRRRFVELESNVLHLMPGVHFSIGAAYGRSGPGHPRADVAEKPLLMVEQQTIGNASGELTVVGTAVFVDDGFVTPRVTPKPRVDGVQSALVVGPPGEEIYTDELGRVRVRFHWDREGEYDDRRTCWLRVDQGWAGPGYGAVTVPRVGHEVLVEFLDGDPDQPVVVGRLYNATAKQPYVLPANRTHSGVKSQTSPFADGAFNELLFDDRKDHELLYLQGQRNLMRLVKNNATQRVGKEQLEVVGDHRLAVVRSVDAAHVGSQHLVQMVKEKDLKILAKEDPRLAPRDTWIEVRDEKITITTGGASIVLDGGDVTIVAAKGIRLSAAGELTIKGGTLFLNCTGVAELSPEASAGAEDDARAIDDADRTAVAVKELLKLESEAEEQKKLRRGWGFERRKTERVERKLEKARVERQRSEARGGEPGALEKWLQERFAKPPMPEHPYTGEES